MAEAPNVLREQEHSAGLGNGESGALVLGDEVSPEARNFEESTSKDSVKAHSRTVGSAVDEPATFHHFRKPPIEIRLKIWRIVSFTQRDLDIWTHSKTF